MAARKRAREAEQNNDPTVDKMDEDDSSSGDDDDEPPSWVLTRSRVFFSRQDMDIVNVDFELFNYDAEIDFHGVKTLLRQLFDADAQLFDLSGLSDLIVEQNTIGSTCKVDDKANDAYAFLTVLNLSEHRAKAPVAQLIAYLGERAAKAGGAAAAAVPGVLAALDTNVVGLVLAERLLNMPAEVIPPMWSMLVDEIEAAVEDGEPYGFTHYLVVSRTYYEVASSLNSEGSERRQKKAREEASLQYFHPEDEEIRRHAAAAAAYPFIKEVESADSKRAFQEMGIKPAGFMMLIEAGKFQDAVKAVGDYVGSAT
ncbi:p21-C-terminal region-binding protein-domain-containing protein [Lasiosphaeris hirsuta]|uniref:Protein BCP1 n=1 Tax=Lasiosphaeris hirsuta TaxID=260670 RepID=A0AA40AHC5_9PEZI|nr:p21-C-terminal region-binding protein-domain-containing protein [Lasiosphaeris hirsuta]